MIFSTLPRSVAGILRFAPMSFDYRVFLFALTSAGAATLMFALLPALQASQISLTDALRGQGGAVRRGSRLRNLLVVGQVAVALVLVVTALTIARNGAAIGAIDLGFETDEVMSINVRGEERELAQPLADSLTADPRVATVAVTSGNPLFTQGMLVAAAPAGTRTASRTPCTFVSPEFFPILRIPIARGRGFRTDEARSAAPVAIVSAATASAFWPGEDPIGKTIRIDRPVDTSTEALPGYPMVTVIGTVRDMVTGIMITGRDAGHIYLPMSTSNPHASAILVRGRTARELNPTALDEIFRRVVSDPQVFEALPLSEMRDLQMYPLQAASWVGSLLAVALVLSVLGLYGVLTYALSQRRKEIGIRMALGATGRAVVGLVLSQSARLGGIGAIIGTGMAFLVLTGLNAAIHLNTISLLDVAAFAAGAAMVMAATLLAAFQPARRATRINPSEMLRSDA